LKRRQQTLLRREEEESQLEFVIYSDFEECWIVAYLSTIPLSTD